MSDRKISLPGDYGDLLLEVKARVRAAQYEALKAISKELVELYWDIWAHNVVILQRCKDALEREFYIRMDPKFGWTRIVLIHPIENQSYENSLLDQKNFERLLTPYLRPLAKRAVRDEYVFDFLELGEAHNERELDREIFGRMEDFLREMGRMFAFVGSQFRLEVDGEVVWAGGSRHVVWMG